MTTTQITVRIPTEAVEFIDQQVRDGVVKSRAAAVARAIRRERRRRLYEEEAKILAALPAPTPEEEAEEAARGEWARQNAAKVWADLD